MNTTTEIGEWSSHKANTAPTISNIIAMVAPYGGRGRYQREQIALAEVVHDDAAHAEARVGPEGGVLVGTEAPIGVEQAFHTPAHQLVDLDVRRLPARHLMRHVAHQRQMAAQYGVGPMVLGFDIMFKDQRGYELGKKQIPF